MSELDVRRVERQQRLEVGCVEEGIARFKRELASSTFGDTPAGGIALGEMFNQLLPAVEEAREEALAGILKPGKGNRPEWWWIIAYLPAEKLAFITLRTLLTSSQNQRPGSLRGHIRASTMSVMIAANVRLEMEFEIWRKKERDLCKEDPDRYNLYDVLVSRLQKGQVVDTEVFKRWRRKVANIERLDWRPTMRVQVGSKMLGLAVEHGAGWFSIRNMWMGGKSERVVELTEYAKAFIEDINTQHYEVARPVLGPMVCPPVPWVRV